MGDMADLDAAIRAGIDEAVQQIKGCDPDTFVAMAADELRDALVAVLDLHSPVAATEEMEVGELLCAADGPSEDEHLMKRYPCPTVRAIAKALGVET